MLRVIPDWTVRGKASDLESFFARDPIYCFEGFMFTGPGRYLADDKTILIMPVIPSARRDDLVRVWHQKWDVDAIFVAHFYFVNIEWTLFGAHSYPPSRMDTRTR